MKGYTLMTQCFLPSIPEFYSTPLYLLWRRPIIFRKHEGILYLLTGTGFVTMTSRLLDQRCQLTWISLACHLSKAHGTWQTSQSPHQHLLKQTEKDTTFSVKLEYLRLIYTLWILFAPAMRCSFAMMFLIMINKWHGSWLWKDSGAKKNIPRSKRSEKLGCVVSRQRRDKTDSLLESFKAMHAFE